jgi:phosphate starvation-inducible PhoH-like protein
MSRRPKYLKSVEELVPQETLKTWQEERDENVKARVIDIKPLNRTQERFLNAILTSVITIAIGPAGTGRSFLSCAAALKLFYEGKANKIILCRPQVTCGEYGGFLPGNEEEKARPFLFPLIDAISEFIGDKECDKLIKEGHIILATLGLMRGSSFKNSVIILDEAENANYKQLKMFLTRLGRNCTMVINGDYSQSDLGMEKNDFPRIIDQCSKLKDEISIIQFEKSDIVRSGIVRKLVEILD